VYGVDAARGHIFFNAACRTGLIHKRVLEIPFTKMKTPQQAGAFEIRLESATAALFRSHDCLHFLFIDVEVGGDALDVVMFFERFDQP
jgi:hypothetical protein